MPFGLRNASQTFQRFIDYVLRGLDFCCAYVDDILSSSMDEEEHLRHFRRLDDYGLAVNAEKCCFGRAEVSFLGHRRFVPNCAEIAASLILLTGGHKGPIKMSSDQLTAFERLKPCLAKATTLAFPSPAAQLSLMVDASKTAIGAVLNQGEGDHRRPLTFFSKAL